MERRKGHSDELYSSVPIRILSMTLRDEAPDRRLDVDAHEAEEVRRSSNGKNAFFNTLLYSIERGEWS